jgi:uncharacterized protein
MKNFVRKVRIPFEEGTLEGEFSNVSSQEPQVGIILCHPHPLYGGNMQNNVIQSIFRTLSVHGYPILRFNFRGVGNSDGISSNGEREQEDIEAAYHFLKNQQDVNPSLKIVLIGYSFGAAIGGAMIENLPDIYGYIGISYPFVFIPQFISSLQSKKSKFLITGTNDDFTPLSEFEKQYELLPDPKDKLVVPGVDHFWRGFEQKITSIILDWIIKLN